MTRERLVNRHLNPLLTTLPDWVKEYRPHQVRAVLDVLDSFSRVDHVFLDANTGAGKTLIAETVRRMLLRGEGKSIYMCSGLELQDQFARDYEYGRVVKGRSNYRPRAGDYLSCADCTTTKDSPSCIVCTEGRSSCPYERAKQMAISSELAVLNTTYFLTEANGPGRFAGRDLVIADECDVLESELMRYYEVQISNKWMKELKLRTPKITVEEDWKRWIDEALPKINERRGLAYDPQDVTAHKDHKAINGIYQKLNILSRDLESGDQSWVFTGREGQVAWKPVRVGSVGQQVLFDHGKKFLLMSGSIISSQQLASDVGLENEYETVRVDYSFDKKNRRVVVKPVGDMSRKGFEIGYPKVRDEIRNICAERVEERVLVHSVSYDLTKRLTSDLGGKSSIVLAYSETSQRSAALAKYRSSPGSILIAPSADRGVDFPDDQCRVIIIPKVPFPNLGDRQVAARVYGGGSEGRAWYNVQTVRTIIQMVGRGVRHADDYCTTYILDSQFVKFYSANRGLFPAYFREAIEWQG